MDRKTHHVTGISKKRIDKIVISAELEKEMNSFIANNKQRGFFTEEMDAVLIEMRKAKIPYRLISKFITVKIKPVGRTSCINRHDYLVNK